MDYLVTPLYLDAPLEKPLLFLQLQKLKQMRIWNCRYTQYTASYDHIF